MAESGAAAETMVQAAKANDRVLDVSFNDRQRGQVDALKEIIDPGGWARSATPRPTGCGGRGSPASAPG